MFVRWSGSTSLDHTCRAWNTQCIGTPKAQAVSVLAGSFGYNTRNTCAEHIVTTEATS
jgi:hypothetical protein